MNVISVSLRANRRANGDEPLLLFKEAKKVLQDIYKDLRGRVDELGNVYTGNLCQM